MPQTNRKTLYLLSFLSLVIVHPIAGEGARVFEPWSSWDNPEGIVVSTDELFPNPPYARDWQSQSYMFIGRLDDGTFFAINLFHWRVTFAQSWGLLVLVTDNAGKLYRFEGTPDGPDRGDPRAGFDHVFRNAVFKSSGSEARIRISLDSFSCDLLIRNVLPAWIPGDGWAYYDASRSAYNRYALPAPLATVTGSMLVFGRSLNAEGQCSWDSNFMVQPLRRLNSPQYYFRCFTMPGVPSEDRFFIDLIESQVSPAYGSVTIPVLLVAKGSAWLFTTKHFSLVPTDWSSLDDPPYAYPRRYLLSAAGRGWRLDGEYLASRVYEVTDVFRKIPRILRPLVSVFYHRPVIYRMVGEFNGRLVSPDGQEQRLALPGHGEYVIVK